MSSPSGICLSKNWIRHNARKHLLSIIGTHTTTCQTLSKMQYTKIFFNKNSLSTCAEYSFGVQDEFFDCMLSMLWPSFLPKLLLQTHDFPWQVPSWRHLLSTHFETMCRITDLWRRADWHDCHVKDCHMTDFIDASISRSDYVDSLFLKSMPWSKGWLPLMDVVSRRKWSQKMREKA